MIEVSKKRLKFLDDAKGLGMMMIVWMHIWGNNTFEFAPPELLNSYITGIYVPLFFVLSGYLVRIERVNIENDIKKKVKSVLRPFLVVYLFSFISSFILFVMGIGTKHDFEWGNVFNPIFSKSFFNGPLWFLLALFWAFVFFLYNHNIVSRKGAYHFNCFLGIWLHWVLLIKNWGNLTVVYGARGSRLSYAHDGMYDKKIYWRSARKE